MRLILVRHAESEANAKGIIQGQKIDTSLSKLGEKQVHKLAERLKEEKLDIIYSSDLKRAKETAKIVARNHDLEIKLDKRLRERAHGKEDTESVIKRVKEFFNEIKDLSKTILVVSHGQVNRTLMAITTGDRKKDGELANQLKQPNTCVNIIESDGEGHVIKLQDCVEHLK